MKNFSLQAFLDDLKMICAIDSGHKNAAGTNAVADWFESRYQALGLHTERRYYEDNDFAPVLFVSNCEPKDAEVMMAAHMDTVFPVGTAAEWPLTVDENAVAHAPGCVDCKGGGLLLYYLLRDLIESGECRFRFCAVYNSDEETGSLYSRPYFEELAQTVKYAFIFEPGRPNDEYVGVRKGGNNYTIICHGIAAHSGVEPEKGASAILELSRWVNEIYKLNDFDAGTTVNIGRFTGGGDNGAVPDYAECTLSYRYLDPAAETALQNLFARMQAEPFDPRTSIEIVKRSARPAMALNANTEKLFAALEKAAQKNGQTAEWLTTGGGSDGNWVAHYGVATLDGCGPCGGSLHTRNEYLKTWTVEQRLDTLRTLFTDLF